MNKSNLLATVAVPAFALGMVLATPAYAQSTTTGDQSTPTPATTAPATTDASQNQPSTGKNDQTITVTGTISRNPAAATASPVVSLTSQDLANRGISTVAEALQALTANNAGTAPPSWSSFGFATGASAPSLRGLNDAYTLTLFDGMRTAPYPLGDDGYRNFVDINTIPQSIVDRVDALLDGASATYGSDAIAGVINVITKRQVTGIHANASYGISQKGDADERRLSATVGYGNLDTQRFNVYLNGEYQHNDPLMLGDRGAPFNTADQSSICGTADQGCLFNGIRNGIQYNGNYLGFQSTTVPYVRPYSATFTSLGGYQLANPSAGCQNLTPYDLTAAQRAAAGTTAGGQFIAPATVCQQDLVKQYRVYNSETTRWGANLRGTMKLGDNAEAFAMFNFYDTKVQSGTTPGGYTGQTAAGGTQVVVSSIYLPAYVCPTGVGQVVGGRLYATGCTASNGTLNPNNPFAAAGNQARLVALPQVPRTTTTDNKVYRFSAGIGGEIGDGWAYNLAGTHSSSNLTVTQNGYIYLQGLLDAVAHGTYNFVDPSQNSQAAMDQVFPENRTKSQSKLTQILGTLNKDVWQMPGGALNIAVAAQYRKESIDNPSANPPNNVNPNARYYSVNAVGVKGSRSVWSVGYDITVPLLTNLKLKAEGSYDHYSTKQSAFSPKFEAEFTPVRSLKLRGTFSKGFRIPSFSESFALPTTGYVSAAINCASPTYTAFCAAHSSNPSYYAGTYSYGLTSEGNPNLKPEKSTSGTLGFVFTPSRRITFTADYWNTKITNVIVPTSVTQDIINQYYTNNGVVNVPGIVVTPGVADQNNPGALPLLGFVAGSYKNADSFLARGMDFSLSTRFPLANGIRWNSTANASVLLRLSQTDEAGNVSIYDGTLGACNITSCSGAPRYRVTWANTLDFNGRGNVTLTANYTSGYSAVATDSGGVYGDCYQSGFNGQLVTYDNGDPVQCYSKDIFDLDGHAEVKVLKQLTIYGDVLNILNDKPPYDPNAAYGLYQFNPAWADRLFIGRYFRIGAKVDF